MRRPTLERRPLRDGSMPSGGGAAPARTIKVVEGASNTTFWQLTGSSALAGSANMTVMCVARCLVSPPTTDLVFGTKYNVAARGYRGRALGSNPPRHSPMVTNGVAATVTRTTPFTANTLVGTFYTFGFTTDGLLLRTFEKGQPVGGAGTACVGYTPATSADAFVLAQATTGFTHFSIAAVVIAENTTVSDANIAAWHAQVATSNAWNFPGGGTTHVWTAEDADAGGGVVLTDWVDRVSGVTVTKTGAGGTALNAYVSPVFA